MSSQYFIVKNGKIVESLEGENSFTTSNRFCVVERNKHSYPTNKNPSYASFWDTKKEVDDYLLEEADKIFDETAMDCVSSVQADILARHKITIALERVEAGFQYIDNYSDLPQAVQKDLFREFHEYGAHALDCGDYHLMVYDVVEELNSSNKDLTNFIGE